MLTLTCNIYLRIDPDIMLEKCVLQNVIISVLYAFNVGFMYTKSQKIMTAYMSKVRVSRKEIRITIGVQTFTIVIFMLAANGILCVSYHITPPQIVSTLDVVKMLRIHYCNTGYHENFVVGFLTFLQMICLIQAFRGRNLPDAMSVSMPMLYAVFISTMSFAVSFPIVFSFNESDKDFNSLWY